MRFFQNLKFKLQNLLFFDRFKAFITDIFMIYTPILYIMTYVVLGSKEAFRESEFAIFICFSLYCFILSILFSLKSQTLGYMYFNLFLKSDSGEKIGFFLSLFRLILFCFSMSLIFGLIFPFFRKDGKAFHDYICKTKVVKI